MAMAFANRVEAGRALARRLASMPLGAPLVVMALPRGGVPVAAEIARALDAPLDLVLVRKIGAPWQPELAVAALVDGAPPEIVVDEATCELTGVDRGYIEQQAAHELQEIIRRRRIYCGDRPPAPIAQATVIVVDDGIATGTTMRAALKALRRRSPKRLVLAVPVASTHELESLRPEFDEIVCLSEPSPFHAIGLHYSDFHQISDDEVLAALASTRRPGALKAPHDGAAVLRRTIMDNKQEWIMLANASRARLYSRSSKNGQLSELEDFIHPQSRQAGRAIGDTAPGHVEKDLGGMGHGRTSLEPRVDPRQKAQRQFAHELAEHIDAALRQQRFKSWVLIASNPFLGTLKAELSEAATRALRSTVASDFTQLKDPDLTQRVREALSLPD